MPKPNENEVGVLLLELFEKEQTLRQRNSEANQLRKALMEATQSNVRLHKLAGKTIALGTKQHEELQEVKAELKLVRAGQPTNNGPEMAALKKELKAVKDEYSKFAQTVFSLLLGE